MRLKQYWGILLLIIGVNISCTSDVKTEADLLKWMTNPQNGLVKIQTPTGYSFKMKYLPPQFLAFSHLKRFGNGNVEQTGFDSLSRVYGNSLNFLFTIGPDKEKGEKFDIMYEGISNVADYNARVHTLNFDLRHFLSINIKGKEYRPVLTRFESVYGLNKSRNITVVFSPQEEGSQLMKASEYDIVFNDEIFGTGINHFRFQKSDFENTPKLVLNKQ